MQRITCYYKVIFSISKLHPPTPLIPPPKKPTPYPAPVMAVKFHNVYDYTIVQHPWEVSENHKPRVHQSYVREIGQSVRYLTKHKIEL